MEEFSALAARVAASVVELRGCLILSRDGLVLGAFPDGEERLVKPAWLKFAVVGEPEKGFIEFGDEIWTYVRRGPYAAFAVSELGVRPGLLIDQLEQMLYTAEEIRSKREALRLPDVPPAPSGKPRTSLHPEARPPGQGVPSPSVQAAARAPTAAPAGGPQPPSQTSRPPGRPAPSAPAVQPPPRAPAPFVPAAAPAPPEPWSPPSAPPADRPVAPAPERPAARPEFEEEEGTEVDRVALAQELSRLLQEPTRGDENQ